jgi:hypothetical protein
MRAAAAPPADVVADLRCWRGEVARILAQRGAPVAEQSVEPAPSDAVAARAEALLRFAEEAYAALLEREPDPIEDAERAAVFGVGEGGVRHGVSITEENSPGKDVTP